MSTDQTKAQAIEGFVDNKASEAILKPQLPQVPEVVHKRIYKPSGVCSLRTFLSMVGIGVLAGIVVGVLGYFVGFLIPLVLGAILAVLVFIVRIALLAFGGSEPVTEFFGVSVIWGILSFVVAGLGYPVILGLAIGIAVGLTGKSSKCRSPLLAGLAGFLSAVIGYGSFIVMAIWMTGTVQLTSRLFAPSFEHGNLSGWLYIALSLDALMLIGTAALSTSSMVTDLFCENCREWYSEPNRGVFSPELAKSLINSLESGSAQQLEAIDSVPETVYPHMILEIRKCPCERSDFALKANVVWEEESFDDEGIKSKSKKTELLLDTMVPAKLGIELEKLLIGDSAAKITFSADNTHERREKTIKIEAESLEAAREKLKSQIPEGFHLLSEQVISDGQPQSIEVVAETTEEAFTRAQAEIPEEDDVVDRRVLTAPEQKVIIIEAPDEQGAWSSALLQAKSLFGNDTVVKSVRLSSTGSKDSPGKKLDKYEAEILQQAVVEVTYRTKARISVELEKEPV